MISIKTTARSYLTLLIGYGDRRGSCIPPRQRYCPFRYQACTFIRHCYPCYFVTYTAQDNVVVTASGDARICDFGGSRAADASRSVAKPSTGIRGTQRYLSYEIVALPDQYSRHTNESDVWAFGMTVFVSSAYICSIGYELTPSIVGTYCPRTPIHTPRRNTSSESYRGS